MKMGQVVGIGTGLAMLAALLWMPPYSSRSEAAEVSMRTYYFGLLKRGPAWTDEQSQEVIQVSQAHRKNIDAMLSSGKLALAGPFLVGVNQGEDALAGLFIFDVSTKDEAVRLAESDPAVIAGRFTVEVLTWYGPKGITYEGRE